MEGKEFLLFLIGRLNTYTGILDNRPMLTSFSIESHVDIWVEL
jgi:hypothetical protein